MERKQLLEEGTPFPKEEGREAWDTPVEQVRPCPNEQQSSNARQNNWQKVNCRMTCRNTNTTQAKLNVTKQYSGQYINILVPTKDGIRVVAVL